MTRASKHDRDKKKKNPHKPPRSFKEYVKFMAIALVFMVLLDQFVLDDSWFGFDKIKENYYAEQAAKEAAYEQSIQELLPPVVVYPEDGGEYFEAPLPEVGEEEGAFKKDLLLNQQAKPTKKAVAKAVSSGKGKIAIVIDDVGMNLKQSRAAIDLPSEVTLAFLPYAEHVRDLSQKAKAEGHELIIHTPMEAMSSDVSLGPLALRDGMDFAQVEAEFNKMADSFNGYVGINNHMGSRLTQNSEVMGYLMDILRQRGLYFLDSKTIATSVAAEVAKTYGVPYAERDVFMDHEETLEFAENALKKAERIARERGGAIVIGHPKEVTMEALRAWIPTLEAKGLELVPLSDRITVE